MTLCYTFAVNTNRLPLLMGALLLLAGCDRKDDIRAYDAPKDPPSAAPAMAAATPAATSASGDIHWTAPPSWKSAPPGAMNLAAYTVSENPPLKMTVSQIRATGAPAATILANVNRWEGQLGLPPTPEAGIAKVAVPAQVNGRELYNIDLSGPNGRMLAALIPDGANAWTLKMMGPADVVAPHKSEFDEVVKTVHFDAAAAPAATAPPTDAPPADPAQSAKIPGVAAYTLPEGWQVDPRPRPMREATLIVNGNNGKGEVVVTRFGASSLSDLGANINRWRGQVNLPPGDAAAHPPQPLSLAQGPASIREFTGPESDGPNRKRQFVAVVQLPGADAIWFFRFVGPYDGVTQGKPAFESFVKSLKFDEK
jgi:hypothetical protein